MSPQDELFTKSPAFLIDIILMSLSLLHTYISYTPIATAQKRNELTLAPPWTELTLNSTVAREMTIDSHVTRAPLHNFSVRPRVYIRKLPSEIMIFNFVL